MVNRIRPAGCSAIAIFIVIDRRGEPELQASEAKRAAKDAAGAVSHKAKETGSWASDKTRDVVDSVSSGTALQVSSRRRLGAVLQKCSHAHEAANKR